MTVTLENSSGTRQTITVILPVHLPQDPPLPQGPLPFQLGNRRTDTATRSTYFTPAAARALYGGGTTGPRRWHTTEPTAEHGPLRLDGMELLRTATLGDPEQALAVLHFTVTGSRLLAVLRAIAHRHTAGTNPLTGPLDPATLLDGIATPSAPPGVPPYTLTFMAPRRTQTPTLRQAPAGRGPLPDTADAWLWSLASRSNPSDYPTAPETLTDLHRPIIRISADWSALVLRHGAAFLGHRPDTGEGDFYDFAALHARTVYLDALLLGTVQRDHIDALTDQLADVFDGPHLSPRVTALETRIAHFRSTYWRQHLTAHGPANDLLLAYQEQHRLPDRFAEILAEAADYARIAQNQESQQINGALGILTILGLPLGTALGALQVLGDQNPWHLTIGITAALASTAVLLTTRYGRLVLSSLRGTTHQS